MHQENFIIIFFNLCKYQFLKKIKNINYIILCSLKRKLVFDKWIYNSITKRQLNLKIKRLKRTLQKIIRQYYFRVNYYLRMWAWLTYRDRNIYRNNYFIVLIKKKRIIRKKVKAKKKIASLLYFVFYEFCGYLWFCIKMGNYKKFFQAIWKFFIVLLKIIRKIIARKIIFFFWNFNQKYSTLKFNIFRWKINNNKKFSNSISQFIIICLFIIPFILSFLPIKSIKSFFWFIGSWTYFDVNSYNGPYTKHSFLKNMPKTERQKKKEQWQKEKKKK